MSFSSEHQLIIYVYSIPQLGVLGLLHWCLTESILRDMIHAERLELSPFQRGTHAGQFIKSKPLLPSAPHHTGSATYEKRSPFLLLNTSLASYLLFSFPSVSGACLVAAGSWLACRLGFPLSSCARSSLLISPANAPLSIVLLGAVVFELTTALGLIVGFELVAPCKPWACSSWYCRWRLTRSASAFCARSALIDFFAK